MEDPILLFSDLAECSLLLFFYHEIGRANLSELNPASCIVHLFGLQSIIARGVEQKSGVYMYSSFNFSIFLLLFSLS